MIQQTMQQEFRDCTVLAIAHRLETVVQSDLIVVMDDGRVKEYGSPQFLLSPTAADERPVGLTDSFVNHGVFRSMVNELGEDRKSWIMQQVAHRQAPLS